MERIKINTPPQFQFSTTISIRITDLNYGGHVGNDTFLSLIHEARLQFLQHYGYTEMNIEGCGLIMCDAALEFKKELIYGNNVFVEVAADNFSKLGFDLFYQLFTIEYGTKQLVAKAKTGMLCFDYQLKKKVSVPEAAIKKLQTPI